MKRGLGLKFLLLHTIFAISKTEIERGWRSTVESKFSEQLKRDSNNSFLIEWVSKISLVTVGFCKN